MIGQVLGSVVGGLFANSAAKKQAAAMDRANAANNMGYMDARNYFTDLYSKGQGALNDQLGAGAYTGQTLAGLNQMQDRGVSNLFNLGNQGFNAGQGLMNTAGGFGQNFADLYNRAGQDDIGAANAFADANAGPLVDAALRDSRRNLEENTLTNIGLGASGTGNTNSSRAGVAQAIAGRDFMDRAADTSAGIRSDLARDFLNQRNNQFRNQMSANTQLGNVFNTGFGMGTDASNLQLRAGGINQAADQARLDDERQRFEDQRDFAMGALGDYRNRILGGAPRNPATQRANLVDPTAAGLSGAMTGFGVGGKYIQPFIDRMGFGSSGAAPFTGFTQQSMLPYNTMNAL